MKNMERGKFEQSLKNAFEKAEIAPSDKAWTNIELDLEKEKGGNLRKRLMFYQMLAAASVVFALAIGGAGVYINLNTPQPPSNYVALEAPPSPGASVTAPASDPSAENTTSTQSQHTADAGESIKEDKPVTTDRKQSSGRGEKTDPAVADHTKKPAGTNDETVTPVSIPSVAFNDEATGITEDTDTQNTLLAGAGRGRALPAGQEGLSPRALPPLYTPREIRLNIPSGETGTVDPVVAMLARLEQREKEVQGSGKNKKDEDNAGENLWTSIGFAAGSFNNVQSSGSGGTPATASTAMALAAPIVDQETKASGYSYSMGVNVGKKLSGRWVLQGGVNYLTHASEYTANNVVVSTSNFQQQRFRAASTNELVNADAKDLSNKIVYSAPYNVNNSMRYLSIPLQAGYLLVNKTFGLQVNAGVATDLFLQNTIKADSDQLDKISQPGGSDSPYRSVNLSGLFGTEFSYRFGDHYRVALNPGIRYPFNTIYKSDLGVNTTPLTFDVGLRFRYIFH